MKRFLMIGLLTLSSVTWGVALAKGAGHSSAKAISADKANLTKARSAAAASMKANGPSAAQRIADAGNLVKARAAKATKAKKAAK